MWRGRRAATSYSRLYLQAIAVGMGPEAVHVMGTWGMGLSCSANNATPTADQGGHHDTNPTPGSHA